jgi:hypothetical protein
MFRIPSRTSLLALVALAVGLLAGCESNPNDAPLPADEASAMKASVPAFLPYSQPDRISDLPTRQERVDVGVEHMMAASPLVKPVALALEDLEDGATPLADAVALARTVSAEHADEDYAYLLDQLLATRVFKAVYTEDDLTASLPTQGVPPKRAFSAVELDALGYATERFAAHANPNAGLMLTSLRALDGHWPAAKVRATARAAHAASTAWLARKQQKAMCTDCPTPTVATSSSLQTQRMREMETGVRGLAILADGA